MRCLYGSEIVLLGVVIGEDRQQTISLGTRLCTCAVYFRENIQPLLTRPTHFAHAGLARNVLKNLQAAFPRVVKCCILHILFIFSFNTLDKGLNLLLLQLKWLEWKNNGAEWSTTDIGLYNGAEFGQNSGLCCRWLNS